MKQAAAIENTGVAAQPVSLAKSYYVLALLTLVWALSFTNRSIINVVLEPIKKEFNLSDTVMGLMVGFGFILIYSILSMPLARFADRKGRIPIIATGIAFWSVMTWLGGLAQTVTQLLLTRIGLGIGESCATAPGNSLVSDYFSKDKRPMAMAILSMAPVVGGYGAFLIGGFAATYWGWRSAFFLAGFPGLLIAALLYFTVKEPPRGLQDGKNVDTQAYGLGETLRYFVKNRTYFFLMIGFCFTGYADLTLGTWLAAYLMRVHALTMLQVSTVGGTIQTIGGVSGVLLGGFIVAHLGKMDDKWRIFAPGITSLLAGPALVFFLYAPMPWAWVGLACSVLFMGFRMGPLLGLVQSVVKVRMRAFAAATIFMIGNLFGAGLGPLIIGASNDYLNSTYGPLAIRYSLLSVPAMSMLGALFFLGAVRHVKQDIKMSLMEG